MISIKLLDNAQVVSKKVNTAIASAINSKIKSKQSSITSQAKSLALQWLMSQPEISSLAGGELAGAFGLPIGSGPSVISAISRAFVDTVYCKIQLFDRNLKNGGIFIYFQPSDFSNLLSLPEGHVLYGLGDLHWLQWLLERGDQIIVAGYSYNAKSGLGRSRLGYMAEGGAFRVPPEFSGTESDNFITRALIGSYQEQAISNIIQKALA